MKNIINLVSAMVLLCLAANASAAVITIDFESESVGFKPNGYSTAGAPNVEFSTTIGSNLRVYSGSECISTQCLLAAADDPSAIQIDLSFVADSISLEFGNDELYFEPYVQTAALFLYLEGGLVGQQQVEVNNNDVVDQSISSSGIQFDRATFQYLDGDGAPAQHAEVIDNVQINPVPIPTAAWLFGSALLGLGAIKRRKA